jgi:hypothetical protein
VSYCPSHLILIFNNGLDAVKEDAWSTQKGLHDAVTVSYLSDLSDSLSPPLGVSTIYGQQLHEGIHMNSCSARVHGDSAMATTLPEVKSHPDASGAISI